jgi:hypothetical protein
MFPKLYVEGSSFKKKLFSCLVYSQIWLNLRVDDGHFCYITNLTTQKPWVNHGQNLAIHLNSILILQIIPYAYTKLGSLSSNLTFLGA